MAKDQHLKLIGLSKKQWGKLEKKARRISKELSVKEYSEQILAVEAAKP